MPIVEFHTYARCTTTGEPDVAKFEPPVCPADSTASFSSDDSHEKVQIVFPADKSSARMPSKSRTSTVSPTTMAELATAYGWGIFCRCSSQPWRSCSLNPCGPREYDLLQTGRRCGALASDERLRRASPITTGQSGLRGFKSQGFARLSSNCRDHTAGFSTRPAMRSRFSPIRFSNASERPV